MTDLTNDIETLKATIKKHSTNSSKPPSSDGYKKTHHSRLHQRQTPKRRPKRSQRQNSRKRAAPFEETTKQRILAAKNANFYETGIRVAGKLYWLHTASTSDSTHLFVHEKHGKEALESEQSIIKDYTGTAVHDCWGSYFGFEESRHILCGAHLLRKLNGLKENESLWATEMHEFLLNLYKIPRWITIEAKEELRAHYHAVFGQSGSGRTATATEQSRAT